MKLLANNQVYLKLSNGGYVIVDAHRLSDLRDYTWSRDKSGRVNGIKSVSLAQIINKTPKGFVTDHVDGDLNDYTEKNLRTATHSQNLANARKRKGCSSIYKGVSWNVHLNLWHARIMVDGKLIRLGLFDNEVDAAKRYDSAAWYFYINFSKRNFEGLPEPYFPGSNKSVRDIKNERERAVFE